jgi:hypothetical protein
MNQANKMRGFDAKKDKYIGKYKCFNCGETHHHIECHEVWDFDLKTKTQNLVKVVGLCHNCHSACHYGKASNLEKTIYRQWLFVVNRDTFSDLNELEEYLQYCWHKRQSYEGINFQINDESVKKVFDWAREEIKKHKRNNTKAFNITITNN